MCAVCHPRDQGPGRAEATLGDRPTRLDRQVRSALSHVSGALLGEPWAGRACVRVRALRRRPPTLLLCRRTSRVGSHAMRRRSRAPESVGRVEADPLPRLQAGASVRHLHPPDQPSEARRRVRCPVQIILHTELLHSLLEPLLCFIEPENVGLDHLREDRRVVRVLFRGELECTSVVALRLRGIRRTERGHLQERESGSPLPPDRAPRRSSLRLERAREPSSSDARGALSRPRGHPQQGARSTPRRLDVSLPVTAAESDRRRRLGPGHARTHIPPGHRRTSAAPRERAPCARGRASPRGPVPRLSRPSSPRLRTRRPFLPQRRPATETCVRPGVCRVATRGSRGRNRGLESSNPERCSTCRARSSGSSVDEHLRELLREQWIAPRFLEQDPLRIGRQDGLSEQRGDQQRGVLIGKGRKADR